MPDHIRELLHRNLQEVFGEGGAARRRAAIHRPIEIADLEKELLTSDFEAVEVVLAVGSFFGVNGSNAWTRWKTSARDEVTPAE